MDSVPGKRARKERRLTNAAIRKINTMGTYLDDIFDDYDRENTGYLNAPQIKSLIERYADRNASIEDVEDFIASFSDTESSGIDKDDLKQYIVHSAQINKEELEEYKSRGPLQSLLIDCSHGIRHQYELYQLTRQKKIFAFHEVDSNGQHFDNPLFGKNDLKKLRTPSSEKQKG